MEAHVHANQKLGLVASKWHHGGGRVGGGWLHPGGKSHDDVPHDGFALIFWKLFGIVEEVVHDAQGIDGIHWGIDGQIAVDMQGVRKLSALFGSGEIQGIDPS